MPTDRRLYVGPRLRRLRRDLGLTQADMAADLEVSPSYVALLERNNRPLTADLLVRLTQTYKVDMAVLTGQGGADDAARLQAVLKDPMFADIDLPSMETADVAGNFPGITEALLRLYTTYQEEQLALADRSVEAGAAGDEAPDPVAESRRFLAARRNSFPSLDDGAERLAQAVSAHDGLVGYFKAARPAGAAPAFQRHGRLHAPAGPSPSRDPAGRCAGRGQPGVPARLATRLPGDGGRGRRGPRGWELRHRERRAADAPGAGELCGGRGADALHRLRPAVEARRYDVEALARQFGASFEQTAHRLTTLQKPGQERVPFFFIRVDPAGNVSKRLDGAGFPFARHGGGCPLWSVHHAFRTPREIVTQWLELPDGQRFFSIARTVTAGGGAFGTPRVERAIALGCAAEHAGRLVYTQDRPGFGAEAATPIGVTCRLCQRTECTARSEPPIGRQILPDDIRRTSLPFGFSDN